MNPCSVADAVHCSQPRRSCCTAWAQLVRQLVKHFQQLLGLGKHKWMLWRVAIPGVIGLTGTLQSAAVAALGGFLAQL